MDPASHEEGLRPAEIDGSSVNMAPGVSADIVRASLHVTDITDITDSAPDNSAPATGHLAKMAALPGNKQHATEEGITQWTRFHQPI